MTPQQREYVTLYEKGYGVREIAKMLHKSPSTVSTGLKRVRRPKKERAAQCGTICQYSATCFTCPLPDCRIDCRHVDVNLVPVGFDYVKEVERA